MDFGSTQYFEVFIFKNADRSDEGTCVFSKKETGKFPNDDWQGFKKKIAEALASNKEEEEKS